MEMAKTMLVVAAVAAVMMLMKDTAGETFSVGDDNGWRVIHY